MISVVELGALTLVTAGLEIGMVSSGPQHTSFTCRMPPPSLKVVEKAGRAYVRLRSGQERYTSQEGWPMLPVYRWLIALPPGSVPEARARWKAMRQRHGVTVWPRPRLRQFKGKDGLPYYREVFAHDDAAYRGVGPYPPEPIETGVLGVAGGVRLGYVEVCPFQYFPRDGRLVWYEEVSIDVSFSTGGPDEMTAVAGPVVQILAKMVLNPEWLGAFHQKRRGLAAAPHIWATGYCKVYTLGKGLYRIRGEDLAGAGVDLDEIDPATLRLDGPNGSLPIQAQGLDDGAFAPGDWLQFYAPDPPFEYRRYSDLNCSWLGWGGEAGPAVSTRSVEPGGEVTVVVENQPVTVRWEEEKERVEFEVALRGYRWSWELVSAGRNQPDEAGVGLRFTTFSPSLPVAWRVMLKGKTTKAHHALVRVNAETLADTTWSGTADVVVAVLTDASMLRKGTNLLKLRLPGDLVEAGNEADQVHLDWVEADFSCSEAAADTLRFWGRATEGTGRYRLVVSGFDSPEVDIWDVTDSLAPVVLEGVQTTESSGQWTVTFEDSLTEGESRTYLARGRNTARLPHHVELYEPAGILDDGGAGYVVITHQDFRDEADYLAWFRGQRGMVSAVVETRWIYDEFSWGLQSPEAIRAFISYAYHNWAVPLAYVLLLGDGSNDYKDYYATGDPNWVPPYMDSTYAWQSGLPSDNWYAAVDGSDYMPDLAIGRLPARSAHEADVMVRKIVSYESAPDLGIWRIRSLYVADDGSSQQGDPGFAADAEDLIELSLPPSVSPRRVYLSYNGAGNASSEAMAHARDKARAYYKPLVRSELSEGCLLSTYIGHGGKEVWTSEWIFGSNDMELLTNGSKLPWMRAYSCHNGWFDDPLFHRVVSETALREEGAGAVAYWASTRGTGGPNNRALALALDRAIFQDSLWVMGDATVAAKLQSVEESIKQYTLFGDPAMTLGLPSDEAVLTCQGPTVPGMARQGDTVSVTIEGQGSGSGWLQAEDASGVSFRTSSLGTRSGAWELPSLALPLNMPNGEVVVRAYVWGDAWEAVGWTGLSVAAWSDTVLVTPEHGTDGPRCNAKGTVVVEAPPWAVPESTLLHLATGVIHTTPYQALLDPVPVPTKPQGWAYAPRFLSGQDSVPNSAPLSFKLSYDPGWLLDADVDSILVCRWSAEWSRWIGMSSELDRGSHLIATDITELGGAEYALFVVYDDEGPTLGKWRRVDREEPVVSGDFLRDGTLLEMSLSDPEGINPSSVTVTIDGRVEEDSLTVELEEPTLERGTIRWLVCGLRSGTHVLAVSARDFYGNDSEEALTFLATTGLELAQVVPHPSPFRRGTQFTYLISQDVEDVVVDVYTVSGTLVTRLEGGPTEEGFNSIPWDGRDDDGHVVANGVYLYRVKVRSGGRTASKLGRVVKMG